MLEVRSVESGTGVSQLDHQHVQFLPGKAVQGWSHTRQEPEREEKPVNPSQWLREFDLGAFGTHPRAHHLLGLQ